MSTLASKKKGKGNGSDAPKQSSRTAVSPARLAAFQVLRRVEEDSAFASVLLASLSDEELRADDRALCYELVLGVLRWQLWLDHLIEHYARRKALSLDAPVRRALRLGLYQLRFLARVPPSAAVNESVNLVKQARLASAASFVNAVLRRATREPAYDPTANIVDPVTRLAVETSHPLHLIERWSKAFGVDETKAFAHANNEVPPNSFRLTMKTMKTPAGQQHAEAVGKDVLEQLRAAGGKLEPSFIAQESWRIEGAGNLLRELARDGAIYIQDEASQLIAHVLDAKACERVLDACAAPGGKTTHIAAKTNDKAFIVAGDVHEHRLRTVFESCARQGVTSVRPVVFDAARALPFAPESFERVLVDAPCSGTGTLRRNPEIRWRIQNPDIEALATQQKKILDCAAQTLRKGGRLLYSTCSVEVEENEAVVDDFLSRNNCFRQLFLNVPDSLKTAKGFARTWPQRDGADGFFVALLERVI